jgi:hypothetical protein
MNTTRTLYWLITGLLAAFMLLASVPDVLRTAEATDIFRHLGYPQYLLPFLGTAKILGVLAVIVPAGGRLREWAYAGIAFDLIGAWYSHLSVGDGPSFWILPLIGFVLLTGSYALRLRTARTIVANGSGGPQAARDDRWFGQQRS